MRAATDTGIRVCTNITRKYKKTRSIHPNSGSRYRCSARRAWRADTGNYGIIRGWDWRKGISWFGNRSLSSIYSESDFHTPVKPIENLSGHTINPYQIHGGKSVLLVRNEDQTKMEEGDYFAIETFGSTGRGRVVESVSSSYFKVFALVLTELRRGKFPTMRRFTMHQKYLSGLSTAYSWQPLCSLEFC